jgi:hypothetical protein
MILSFLSYFFLPNNLQFISLNTMI